MEGWQTLPLGEALTFQRGFDITKDEQRDGPYPVISSSGTKSTHAEFKVHGPGVIIGRKGSLGTVFYSATDYWPHDTTLWVRDFHGNYPRFAYYFVQTMGFERLDAGASNPSLNRNHIHTIPVHWPPPSIQRRIADILSSYDELMENCQRRIRILEEMARALYREWFVHFRFPGHEKVPRVDSPLGPVPKGWEVKLLGDILELKYGKALKQENRSGGSVPVYASSGIVGYHNEKLASGPGVIVGRKGNVGSVFWCDEDFFVIDTAYYVTASVPLRFLYYDLQTKNFLNNDAAVPGLSRHQAYTLETVIPPADLLSRFCRLADDFERQASTLRRQIDNLRRTRDLLLPRLLSGQVPLDVSEDVAEPTTSAPPSEMDFASEEPALRAAEEAPRYDPGSARFQRAVAGIPAGDSNPAPRSGSPHELTALPERNDLSGKDAEKCVLEARAPQIHHTERTDVLQIIRQVFSEGPPRPRDDAIRDVARALGYRRTGEKIREVLHTDLLTAVRRGILENTDGTLRLCARSITDLDRDFLKQQFLAAIGRPWIDRDTATRDFCRWLGFARTGPVIEDTARSLINGLLREGRVQADGTQLIRRV